MDFGGEAPLLGSFAEHAVCNHKSVREKIEELKDKTKSYHCVPEHKEIKFTLKHITKVILSFKQLSVNQALVSRKTEKALFYSLREEKINTERWTTQARRS